MSIWMSYEISCFGRCHIYDKDNFVRLINLRMPVKQHPGWTTKGPGLYTSDECDSEDDGRRQHATDSLPVTATIEKQAKGAFDVFISDSKSGRSTAAPGRSGQVADIADAIESARSTFENFMQMMSKVVINE